MNEPSQIRNVPLEEALKEGDNLRVSQTQIMQRGADNRSGNVIVKDGSNPRVLLGNQLGSGTTFYGMKVSKPGYDVNNATSDQLIFNSDQNVFKIVSTGTTSVTFTGTGLTTQTIAHNLGYTPVVLAFLNSGTFYQPLPASIGMGLDTVNSAVLFNRWIYVEADQTSLYVQMVSAAAGTSGPFSIKYYLLQETAN